MVDEADVQPGAYVTDGVRLYEILSVEDQLAHIENCGTGAPTAQGVAYLCSYWSLVRAIDHDLEVIV